MTSQLWLSAPELSERTCCRSMILWYSCWYSQGILAHYKGPREFGVLCTWCTAVASERVQSLESMVLLHLHCSSLLQGSPSRNTHSSFYCPPHPKTDPLLDHILNAGRDSSGPRTVSEAMAHRLGTCILSPISADTY